MSATPPSEDEHFIFIRFQAISGLEAELEEAIHDVIAATREEPGCLAIHAFRGLKDPRDFIIHSRWRDEAAFDAHGKLPHTMKFLERASTLIERDREVTRASLISRRDSSRSGVE